MVIYAANLSTQIYKVWIKGKRNNPVKSVVAIEKGAFESLSITVG